MQVPQLVIPLSIGLVALDAAAAPAPPLASEREVASAVLRANPELEAVEAQIDALEHAVPQAGVWADPVLAVEYSSVPLAEPVLGENPMSGVQVRLEQRFPWPGKTGARERVAAGRVRVGREELREKRNVLVGRVRDLYHRLALVRQLKEITRRHVSLIDELLGVVDAAYRAGRAHQHELVQLTVRRDGLDDSLDELAREERELLAVLNATLHRPADAPVATPEKTRVEAAPETAGPLLEVALRDRPLLEKLARAADVERLAAERARKERWPDVTLWGGYRLRQQTGGAMGDAGEDLVSAGISVPLPWMWNDRRWGELAEQHRSWERSLGEQREAAVDAIGGELEAALARWRRGLEKAGYYETTLVREQEQALDAVLAAYRVGRADFASLYDAEVVLLDLERGIRIARTEAARAAAAVATLTGTNLAESRSADGAQP